MRSASKKKQINLLNDLGVGGGPFGTNSNSKSCLEGSNQRDAMNHFDPLKNLCSLQLQKAKNDPFSTIICKVPSYNAILPDGTISHILGVGVHIWWSIRHNN